MHKQLFLFICSIFFISTLSAQVLVKSEKINSLTQLELFALGLPASNDIDLYKVWYNTAGIDGTPDVASGLVIIPKTATATALVCYQHGTASPRTEVPSNEKGHFGELYLGSNGFVISSADYLGMGESEGFHPYLHAETEASAAIDLLRAVREFCEELNVELNDQLFVTGYSQGGHAAMAAFRTLERDFSEEFSVTAAAPMSGPYNVSGTMLNNLLTGEEYFFPGYLTYIVKGYQSVYGDIYENLSDIFKPQYAEIMEDFNNEDDFTVGELNQKLIDLLVEEQGKSLPAFMFQQELIDAVLASDETHPLIRAFNENNLYNWIPEAPTRLYYCEADDQVPFQNAIFTDSIMNMNGANSVKSISMGETLDHLGCAFPAFIDVLSFFESFKATNTKYLDGASLSITLYPNPVKDILTWDFSGNIERVEVTDELGRVVLKHNENHQRLGVAELSSGVYFLQLHTDKGVIVKKFVK